MKPTLAALGILLTTLPVAQAAPAPYTLNKDHTDLLFAIDHSGFSMKRGWFTVTDGTLMLDVAQLEASSVDITVAASSVATNNDKRDQELRGAGFFDTARFPTLRFISTRVTRTSATTLDVLGNLTLHGVTRPLLLHARVNRLATSPFTKLPAAGFSAEGTLKRSDYGILTLIPLLGDDVSITIEAEFSAQQAQP